ncbi:MAG: helix-turn-helix domain-containing protein [Methanomicrobiales archaeon]|nr:helix-turn-helix domain-containing protein [Methanomicrobiales archaeon]
MEKLPCETIVWDLLPAIRAVLAGEMVKRGLSQKMVANMLNMAPSAVSQYISGKRGYRISFSPEVTKAISELANDMIQGNITDPRDKICNICYLVRGGDAPCSVCAPSDIEPEKSGD